MTFRNLRLLLGVVVAMPAPGCADDVPVERDAGSDAQADAQADGGEDSATALVPGLDFEVAAPAMPVAAQLVRLTPCPAGWLEVEPSSEGGARTCEPWGPGVSSECGDDEALFVGEPACARIGPECPPDGWPAGLPPGASVIYVSAAAPDGGDGTRGAPYRGIAPALAAASRGTIVAVAAGTYDEAVSLTDGVTLWGACVGGTHIVPLSRSGAQGAITVVGDGTVVRDLTISGVEAALFAGRARSGPSTSVDLQHVLLADANGAGIVATEGTQISGSDVVIRDIAPRSNDATLGVGMLVDMGASVRLERLVVERARTVGIGVYDAGTRLELTGAVVRDTREQQSDRLGGTGVEVSVGASVELTRTVLERNVYTGIVAQSGSTVLRLTDAIVRDTRPGSDRTQGVGVSVALGATATLARVLLDRNLTVGLSVFDPAPPTQLTDVVVRGTRPNASRGELGSGIEASAGAALSGERVSIEDDTSYGVRAVDDGTVVSLRDLTVLDTRARERDGELGRGIQVQGGAALEVERARIERTDELGAFAIGEGSAMRLTDVAVRDVRSLLSGHGVHVQDGATAGVTRLVLERCHNAALVAFASPSLEASDVSVADIVPGAGEGMPAGHALYVGGGSIATVSRLVSVRAAGSAVAVLDPGTIATLSDVAIRETAGDPSRRGGFGLIALGAGAVEIDRIELRQNHSLSLGADEPGSSIRARQVRVLDTLQRECAVTDCADFGSGIGVAAYGGASVELRTFLVSSSAMMGLQIARDGAMDLHDGVVRDCPIGANVQDIGFEIGRLQDGVVFWNNTRNLDSATLPEETASATAPVGSAP